MAIKQVIKKTLEKGKEGLNIASDIAYEKYKTTKNAVDKFLYKITPEYSKRMNAKALKDRERINKNREERGLKPLEW